MSQNGFREWINKVSPVWLPEDLSITINAETMEAQLWRLRVLVQIQPVARVAIS